MFRHSSTLAMAAFVFSAMASAVLSAEPPAAAASSLPSPPSVDELPFVYTNWRHFTVEDGLPDDHILAVKADGPRVWIGTEDGLACIDKPTGKIKVWEFKDEDNDGRADEPYSLPWRAITAIDVDKRTGDMWLGLFGGGLARFSAGRFDHFHQLNSGLVNDVVYGVAVQDENVWAATTAGASRYNTVTGEWSIYTEKNAPMEEIWNYGVSYDGKGKVFLAVWGSGCLDDAGDVFLARREGGTWKYHSRSDLQIPEGQADLASADAASSSQD
ncbi:MAG: hypothetical protein FJ276_30480 [Planctomycetes bacterium]|nr:hypothetical protein [Planctomycetota bacterium]